MSTVTAGKSPAHATQPVVKKQKAAEHPALLSSDTMVLAGMLTSIGVYYLVPFLPLRLLGLLVFFALTLYRPALHLAMVPIAAPLFYRQQPVLGLSFPLAEVIIVVGVGAWALRDGWAFLRFRKLPLDQLRATLSQPLVLLALGFGAIGVLWLLVPPDTGLRRLALREFRWTVAEPLLFFALMLRWIRSEKDMWRIVAAWLLTAALLGREGFEQYLFGETLAMEGVGRVTSVYPSATAFGIYMGRALPLGIVLAIFLPPSWRYWKIAAAIFSLAIGLGLLFSFARGAWIGTFAALLAVAFLTRQRILVRGLAGAVVVGLALLPFVQVERITSIFDFSSAENTGVSRFRIWASALRVLRDHPFSGIGQDQFLYQDAQKYGIPHIRFLEVAHPHNFLLDFWLRLGIPGLAAIGAILTIFFGTCLRLWRELKGTALGALTLGLIASMTDFVVHGLLDMAYFTMDLALTFWLTVGLIVVLNRGVVLREEQFDHGMKADSA